MLPALDEGVVPFAPMEAVPLNRFSDPAYEMRPWTGRVAGTYFERGDILVARITPSFENGKQATTDALVTPFGFASTEVIPVRPISPELTDPRLLFFYLLHPVVRRFVAERMEGSTGRQRVPQNVLLDLPYPILTTDEEHRISDVLAGLYQSIDAEIAAERTAAALRGVVLEELFGGIADGDVPPSWAADELGNRCTVSSGGTPARDVDAFWAGGTIPWVKTAEVNYRLVTETAEHITEEGLSGSSAKLLPPDTVLLAMYGQGVTRGRVAMLGVEAASNQACAAIQTDSSVLLPKLLYHLLAAQYEFIRGRAHGGQQQNLNLDLVRDLPIAYPIDLDEQRRIVEALDVIDGIVNLHGEQQRILRALFVSLFQGLLLGHLAPASLGGWMPVHQIGGAA